jgi:hypothetical protein
MGVKGLGVWVWVPWLNSDLQTFLVIAQLLGGAALTLKVGADHDATRHGAPANVIGVGYAFVVKQIIIIKKIAFGGGHSGFSGFG